MVLVSLAVIFIPIILEGPDDEWSPRTQGMPEPPQIAWPAEGEAELPLPDREPGPPQPVSPPGDAEPVEPAPVADIAPVAPAEPATAPPAPTPPPSSPPAAAAGTWAIQVGRFSESLNAQGLRDRLKKAGYAAFVEQEKTDSGESWRVLVGPLKTRADAEKVRDELAARRQLKGFVVENKG